MNCESSQAYEGRVGRASGGSNGLSLLVALVSPLIAVCLSQYLHTHERREMTFAAPPATAAVGGGGPAGSLHTTYRPQVPAIAEAAPATLVQPWREFVPQTDKRALALKLIDKAMETKDDAAGRFVMLRLAKDVATQANDGETAFRAIDAMADAYHVDADAMKLAVLAKFASAAKTAPQHRSLAEQALKLADAAVRQQRLTAASQMYKLALAEAKKARDSELTAQAQGQMVATAGRLCASEFALQAAHARQTRPD
jgi:hypothetical protein